MSESVFKFLIGVITSWQVITLVAVLLLLKPIRTLVAGISNIKVGDFQVSLQKIGESLGVPTSADDIAALNYDDLKIFLVMCGEDADYYIFKPANMPATKFGRILEKLAANGLIVATLLEQPKKNCRGGRRTQRPVTRTDLANGNH